MGTDGVTIVTADALCGTLTLESDLAAEHPLYIYLSTDKRILFYSTSLVQLLKDPKILKPLEISREGISFLLQSGAVPPPETIYRNLFILSIGDSATINVASEKRLELAFKHRFPFLNEYRLKDGQAEADEGTILQLLAEAAIAGMDPARPSVLFHSAGKDSNSIAIALAEAGRQRGITLLTHRSKGDNDETGISRSVAQKLGFDHRVLNEVDELTAFHHQAISQFFEGIPLPCTDGVILAYPLYTTQLDFGGLNILDGMGNDVFIGHVPGLQEYQRQERVAPLIFLRLLASRFSSTNVFQAGCITRAECTGLSGLSYADTKAIMGEAAVDVAPHWISETKKRVGQDYLDFRAEIRGTIIDQEIFTRKVRSLADFTGANLVLPWANSAVASYFSKLPEAVLFDRQSLRNKLVLRKLLRDRVGLDSDAIGKKAFVFDYWSLLRSMRDRVEAEVVRCRLWQRKPVEKMLRNLMAEAESHSRFSLRARALVHRLYVVSAWVNHSKYVN